MMIVVVVVVIIVNIVDLIETNQTERKTISMKKFLVLPTAWKFE